MVEVICKVCGRKIDSRGLSGHMRTHKPDKGDGSDGVISYPSNGEENKNQAQAEQPVFQNISKKNIKKSKPVKKTVTSKPASSPASSPASKPDPRGQRKSEQEHKVDLKSAAHPKDSGAKEWQGFFRE